MCCSAYLSQSEEENLASSNFAPYDQYEVSVPMDIAGDCLQMVSDKLLALDTHHSGQQKYPAPKLLELDMHTALLLAALTASNKCHRHLCKLMQRHCNIVYCACSGMTDM